VAAVAVKYNGVGLTALLRLRRKSCYGFLSPLKIQLSRPGLSPLTLGPMSNTTRPPRAIMGPNDYVFDTHHSVYQFKNVSHKVTDFDETCGVGWFLRIGC
jgi:hypothetical protein